MILALKPRQARGVFFAPLLYFFRVNRLEFYATWRARVQFAVGFKFQGKTAHVVVDAEDALIAALKVKMQRPEVLIAYVRQQNKRGDTRHPMRRLSSENP